MDNLYNRLSELCKSKGVSNSRMCLDLGLSKSTMSDMKAGRTKTITAATAQKMASYFNVSVGYILGNEETKKDPSEPQLTGIDKELYDLIKLIPEEQKKAFLAMGHAYVSNLSKD